MGGIRGRTYKQIDHEEHDGYVGCVRYKLREREGEGKDSAFHHKHLRPTKLITEKQDS